MSRWPFVIIGGVVLAVTAGACTGATMSRGYWGYVIGPPPMLVEVDVATEVRRVTEISVSDEEPAGSPRDPRRDLQQRHYLLESGVAAPLLQRLRASFLTAPDDPSLDIRALMASLRQAGVLVEGDPGYEARSHWIYGSAIELAAPGGPAMLVLTLASGEVANDHRARYEVLLARVDGAWRIQRWQRTFFDVAGVEYLEGPVLFVLATVVSTGIYLVQVSMIGGALVVVVRVFRSARPAQAH